MRKQEIRKEVEQRRRGAKRGYVVVGTDSLQEVELQIKRYKACVLKAGGFTHGAIAEEIDVSKSVIGHWFEEQEMRDEVASIAKDLIGFAVQNLQKYAIEFTEILIDIARKGDDKTALTAVLEGLDRMGITKVNKSEGRTVTENLTNVQITDPTGLVDKLRNAPPEVQQKAAEHMEALMAITAEHIEEDVTHAST